MVDVYINLSYQFPIWTSLLPRSDQNLNLYTSNALHQKKIISFKNSMRIPDFLECHIEQLSSLSEKGMEFLCDKNKVDIDLNSEKESIYYCLRLEENWMGKNDVDNEEETILEKEDTQFIENNNNVLKPKEEEEEDIYDDFDNFFMENISGHSTPINKNNKTNDELATIKNFVKNKFLKIKKEIDDRNVEETKHKTHLNKKENDTPKTYGKYVVPFPALSILHEQQSNQNGLKGRFLKNGKALAPFNFNKKIYKLENTSVFDSIVELFSHAFRNINDFQSFFLKNKSIDNLNFVNIIVDWCKTGSYTKIYNKRGLILYKHAHIENLRIRNEDNIEAFLSKIAPSHHSYEKKLVCDHCNSNIVESSNVFQFNQMSLDIIKHLEEEMIKYFPSNSHCTKCNTLQMCLYDFGSYLIIDLEMFNLKLPLNIFPSTINIQKNKFILAGLIGYSNIEDKDKTYIAYTKPITGFWRELNSDSRKIMKVLHKIPFVYVGILMYVKIVPNLST